MANFKVAFQLMVGREGGYGNDPDDLGGETYKGIARKMNGKWDGWPVVDLCRKQSGFPSNLESNVGLQNSVELFYETQYWNKINGDQIENQEIANSVFDFAVNAGVVTSSSLAQAVVGSVVDGVIGKDTVIQINKCDVAFFLSSFTLAKIVRYVHIVKKRPISRKYFFGWVCRALG